MAEVLGEEVLAECTLKSPEGQRDKRFSCALTQTKLIVARWGKTKVFPLNQLLNAEHGWRLTPWLFVVGALAVLLGGGAALSSGRTRQFHVSDQEMSSMYYDPDLDPRMSEAARTADTVRGFGVGVLFVGGVLVFLGARKRPYLLIEQSNGGKLFRLPAMANPDEFARFVTTLQSRLGRTVVDSGAELAPARPRRRKRNV